jgi:fibronectin type 3 domain-containing protein
MVKRVLLHLLVISFLVALISCPSPVSVSQPKAPTGMTAAAESQTAITVQWTDTNAGKAAYRLERSTSATSGFSLLGTTAAGATVYADSGLSAGTTYYYRAAALLGNSISDYSSVASVTTDSAATPPTTAPTAPTNLVATANGPSAVTLTWSDTTGDATGFMVTRVTTQTGATPVVLNSGVPLSATTRSYADSNSGLTAATEYGYAVMAVNSIGNSSPSNLAWVTTSSLLSLSAPAGILASQGVFGSSIYVDWSAVSTATKYNVYVASDPAGMFTLLGGVTAKHTSITGCTSNVQEYFEVSAVDGSGNETNRSTPVVGWAGPCVFSECFETTRLQGYWVAGSPAPSCALVAPGAYYTATSLQLSHPSGNAGMSGLLADMGQNAQPSYVGFWFMVTPATFANDIAFFAVSNSTNAYFPVFIDVMKTGVVAAIDASQNYEGNAPYQQNVWCHVECRNINFAYHTYDFYVGGVFYCTVTFPSGAADMRKISLEVYDPKAVVQWDEISVQ